MSEEGSTETESTARAPVNIKLEEDEEITGTKAVIIEDDADDIDPKDVWRVAFPFDEYQLFLRPATISM